MRVANTNFKLPRAASLPPPQGRHRRFHARIDRKIPSAALPSRIQRISGGHPTKTAPRCAPPARKCSWRLRSGHGRTCEGITERCKVYLPPRRRQLSRLPSINRFIRSLDTWRAEWLQAAGPQSEGLGLRISRSSTWALKSFARQRCLDASRVGAGSLWPLRALQRRFRTTRPPLGDIMKMLRTSQHGSVNRVGGTGCGVVKIARNRSQSEPWA